MSVLAECGRSDPHAVAVGGVMAATDIVRTVPMAVIAAGEMPFPSALVQAKTIAMVKTKIMSGLAALKSLPVTLSEQASRWRAADMPSKAVPTAPARRFAPSMAASRHGIALSEKNRRDADCSNRDHGPRRHWSHPASTRT
ncbi:MAG TPA: hypothetical protein VK430_06315 [Xanthobacteraceae bacterium]|nr:hypothetical protein [Xanthobacteraceae bacterium]